MNSIIVYVIELFKLGKVVNELVNIIENDATQIAKDIIKENHSKNSPQLTYEEQVDALNKMKTLLDAGVLTQEE